MTGVAASGFWTVKVSAGEDVPPPGVGFIAVMEAVRGVTIALAGTVAVVKRTLHKPYAKTMRMECAEVVPA